MEILTTDQLRIWAVAVVFLFLKMYSNSILQGIATFKSKKFYFQEDANLFGRGIQASREESDFSVRASTCWENDLENIPVFLFLLLGYALVNGESFWCLLFTIIFCLSRVVHAIALLKAIQPLRNITYQVGIFVCIAMSVGIIRHVSNL